MNYRAWITITITHGYFSSDNCGVDIEGTAESSLLMRKAFLLLRKLSNTKWVLLKPEVKDDAIDHAELIFMEGDKALEFNLNVESGRFYYFSEWENEKHEDEGWAVESREGEHVEKKYLRINITPEMLKGTKDININIANREAYWEFVLFPKHNKGEYPVELRESVGKLEFSQPEEILFLEKERALRSVTKKMVPIKESNDFKIGLWEKREKGELLLCNNIPLPKPDSLSVRDMRQTITSYYYY